MSNAQPVSEREHEIMIAAASGLTDKEICNKLGITRSTVSTYWLRIRSKTGTVNRAQALVKVLVDEFKAAAETAERAMADRDLLLEMAEDYAVFSISPEGTILDWNLGVQRVLGFCEKRFIGLEYSATFTPEDAKAGEPKRELEQAAQHGRCREKRYHAREDCSHVWVDGALVAAYDEEGKVRHFSKIMRDDSERKALEDEVQNLQTRRLAVK